MLVARRRLLRLAVAVVDVVTLIAGLAVAYLILAVTFHREFAPLVVYAWLLIPITLIWVVCLSAVGLYHSGAYNSRYTLLTRLVEVQFIAGLLLFSVMYLTRSEAVSRLLLQSFVAISFVLLVTQKLLLAAYLCNARRRTDSHRRKIVLVSDPDKANRYLRLMQGRASLLSDVVRVLDPSSANGSRPEAPRSEVPFGGLHELPELLHDNVVDEVIAVAPLEQNVLERLSRCCSVRGIVLRIWLDLPCPALGHWGAEYLGDGVFLVSLAGVPQNPTHLLLKRSIDLLGAAIGVLFCGIVYMFYGRRLQRESGGSAIFRQQRIGKNGRAFTLYKFRTMWSGAERQQITMGSRNEMQGPMFKIRNDPRVTTIGRSLRRRYLDELPQFWNVLRGDMSLVGTRPPTADETTSYREHHHRRLSMRPGITGLWQLSGHGRINEFEQVVKLDCEYIDHWSLWLDIKILVRTIFKIVRGDGC